MCGDTEKMTGRGFDKYVVVYRTKMKEVLGRFESGARREDHVHVSKIKPLRGVNLGRRRVILSLRATMLVRDSLNGVHTALARMQRRFAMPGRGIGPYLSRVRDNIIS